MSLNDNLAIHEEDAQRINGVLLHFLGESGAMEALLIDRSGQLLARDRPSRSLDTASLSALAAGPLSPAPAPGPLLGPPQSPALLPPARKGRSHLAGSAARR